MDLIVHNYHPAALYTFEYYSARTRRWIRARYRASIDAIAQRGEPFKIVGEGWTPSEVGGGTAGDVGRGRQVGSGNSRTVPEIPEGGSA